MVLKNQAISRVKEIVKKKGFFYSFLLVLYEDCHLIIDKNQDIDTSNRITIDEANWLLRFTFQSKVDFLNSYPERLMDLLIIGDEIKEILTLLEHAPVVDFGDGIDTDFNSDEAINNMLDFAIRYSGDSAFDYDYLELAEKKYQNFEEWLKENKSFSIKETIPIVKHIEKVLLDKGEEVFLFNNEDFEYFSNGDTTKEQSYRIRISQFAALMSEKFLSTDFNDHYDAIVDFCHKLLNLYTFSESDISCYNGFRSILSNLSIELKNVYDSSNLYDQPGRYNVLDERPIIKISRTEYFLIYPLNLFRAIYETPFYWLTKEMGDLNRIGNYIGAANENSVYEMLKGVFGDNNVFQGILIKNGKKSITDIDVLCLHGSIAICVQVKSKPLSELSRTNNFEAVKTDFEKSVVAAYRQAELCNDAFTNTSCTYWKKDKQEIKIPLQKIKDIYLMCVMCGRYEGLNHHVELLLKSYNPRIKPLVCSNFDLKLLTTYLNNPYDFSYYVRQRINTWDYFKFDNELSALSYHLNSKIYTIKDSNIAVIDSSIDRHIDYDYYQYIRGIKNKVDNRLLWLSPFMDYFCNQIKRLGVNDTLYLIYDSSSDMQKQLEELIKQIVKRSINNDSFCSVNLYYDEISTGFTIAVGKVEERRNLIHYAHSITNKQVEEHPKAKEWHTIGIYSSASISIAFIEIIDPQQPL